VDSRKKPAGSSRTTRAYDASGRQAEAAARRARVVEAARALFLAQGYAATSIAAIAERAGVSQQTVYAQFESKAGILARAVDVAVAGDDEEAGLVRDRPAVAALFAPGIPPRERIRAMSHYARLTHERSAHLLALAESVAGTDDAVASLIHGFREGSRADAHIGAASFAEGELRPELDVDSAGDLMWTLAGWSTFILVTDHAGYTADEYEAWLATIAAGALLAEPKGPRARR
jgi:AcrR family transcriptional regulator